MYHKLLKFFGILKLNTIIKIKFTIRKGGQGFSIKY